MERALLRKIIYNERQSVDKRRSRYNSGVNSASDGLRGLEYEQEHEREEESIRHESEHIEKRDMVSAGRAHKAHQCEICGGDTVIDFEQGAVFTLVEAEGEHGHSGNDNRPDGTRDADIIRLAEIDNNRRKYIEQRLNDDQRAGHDIEHCALFAVCTFDSFLIIHNSLSFPKNHFYFPLFSLL